MGRKRRQEKGKRERENIGSQKMKYKSLVIPSSRGKSSLVNWLLHLFWTFFFIIMKFKKCFLQFAPSQLHWRGSCLGSCLDHCLPTQLSEAAYTLLLYDELLEWSDRPLREFLTYPMQTEWQRKEHLHLAIIQNFDRGKVSGPPYPWSLSRQL